MPTENLENPISQEVVADICGLYGLKLTGIKPCRKVWQLKTDAGYQYLKKSKLNQNDLWFIHEALEFLAAKGFDGASRLMLTKNGKPFAEFQTDLYVMTPWAFGEELDFRIMMDLKEAARFMANFHLASAGFFPQQECAAHTCWLGWPAKLELRLRQLQEFRRLANLEKDTSVFSRLFLRHFEPYYRQAETSYLALLDSPYNQVALDALENLTFCHHDYSGRNILRTYCNRLLLVDFDYCLSDIRIHDLINFLVRNLKHNHWNPAICTFILHEYQVVSPLSPAEIEVMYILLSWPQDFWQVGLQYFYEKLPWPKERFIKKLQHKIDLRLEREKFLQDFSKQNPNINPIDINFETTSS